jgi:uncharacterized membrane protein YgcG
MRMNAACHRMLATILVLFMAVPPWVLAQSSEAPTTLSQQELDQILAPIALYPDSLLAQIFMASTYPLEVVQADRWVKQNPQLKGDALTAALEKQTWDPSVKSLVNFPQVLDMMNEKLDWTTKLGDAFLEQQAEVMDTVQKLRAKANAEGNLKTNSEQKVIVEQQVIKIEPANPQVIYVPTYNPTVVYGPWWYPAYPPYYYYPPGYVAGAALFSFGVGVALGAAWGYAWGGCRWRHHHVDININRNINFNRNINRNHYRAELTRRGQINARGSGRWHHNPEHRKGVAYRDRATARQFNRGSTFDRSQSRERFRGRAESGRRELSRGAADQFRDQRQRPQSGTPQRRDRPATAGPGRTDGGRGERMQSRTGDRRSQPTTRSRGNAFEGVDRGGAARTYSNRGRSSRSSMSGSRSGGFGGRGGGRRGGGGRR